MKGITWGEIETHMEMNIPAQLGGFPSPSRGVQTGVCQVRVVRWGWPGMQDGDQMESQGYRTRQRVLMGQKGRWDQRGPEGRAMGCTRWDSQGMGPDGEKGVGPDRDIGSEGGLWSLLVKIVVSIILHIWEYAQKLVISKHPQGTVSHETTTTSYQSGILHSLIFWYFGSCLFGLRCSTLSPIQLKLRYFLHKHSAAWSLMDSLKY